jgi:hypothetical protein
MPLPNFREDNWLPEGHHPTTWEEIVAVFGGASGTQRARVLANLLERRDRVRAKGLTGLLILDGSFISSRPEPGDFDTIFVMDEGMETILANDIEASLLVNYVVCKQNGWGDIFVFSEAVVRKFPQMCRLDGFDHDKVTKQAKGVVEVRL